MTTILSTIELAKQTGAGRYSVSVLQEIIDEAEREISGRLSQYNLSISSTNELKAASSMLSKAGIVSRMRLDGSLAGDSGAKYYNLIDMDKNYRAEAWKLIESYIRENGTYSQYRYYIRKVNP